MSLPIFVHLLFVMKKPTTGSVTAPQALPMNSTMEAWKALICRAERGQTGVKNTRWHTTHQLVYSFIGTTNNSHYPRYKTHYLSDVEQVDLQEEGRGAGSHLLGCSADGETELAA